MLSVFIILRFIVYKWNQKSYTGKNPNFSRNYKKNVTQGTSLLANEAWVGLEICELACFIAFYLEIGLLNKSPIFCR